MAIVAPTPVTAIPADVPSTADPSNFDSRADALLGALPAFQSQVSALGSVTYTNATEAHAAATAASQSESAAAQSAAAAASSSGAPKWVSGQSYTDGFAVYDPANGVIYRRVGAGSGTVSPSNDPTNWRAIGIRTLPKVNVDTATHTATASTRVVLRYAGAVTVTMPPTPSEDDVVEIVVANGRDDNIVNFNGMPHQDRTWASDPTLKINTRYATPKFQNINAAWRIFE